MKKLILTYLTLGILTLACKGQTERMETQLMNCIYESYEDQGTAFKKAFSEFEKLLIDENILKDTTGESYKAVFEKIVMEDDFNFYPSRSFSDKMNTIEIPQNESFINCNAELLEQSKNDFSKGTELQAVFDSISIAGNLRPSIVANGILSVLNENDFELEYYKMSIFLFFDVVNYVDDDELTRKLPAHKENKIEYDLSNAINVYLDRNNQIFVNKEKVDIEELKIRIREYEFKNKSESIISFKTEKATMYETYLNVIKTIAGEIQILREQFAKEKYNTELDKLTEDQLFEIKKIYPQKLVK